MATVASLMVEVGANVARLQQDMNRVTGIVDRSSKTMTTAFRAVGTAFAGAFSIRAIQSSINEVLKMADATAKLSQSVGVSVETLSSFSHAANLSGTSIETIGRGLGQLSKNMLDTSRGTGQAQKGFEALGITVTKTDGTLKASDEVLGEVAERFANMEDGAGKTALAMELFGKSGKDLIPMLNQGKDGIEAMRAEAERLGLTLSTDMAQQAERVNDNFTRMSGVFKGLMIRIVDGVLPTLENLTNMFADTETSQEDAAAASETLATALKLLVSAGVIVQSIFKALGDTIASVAAAISFVVKGEFRMAFEALQAGGEDVLSTIDGTIGKIGQIWDKSAEEALRASKKNAEAKEQVVFANEAIEKSAKAATEAEAKLADELAGLTHRLRMENLREQERFRQMEEAAEMRRLDEAIRREEEAKREKLKLEEDRVKEAERIRKEADAEMIRQQEAAAAEWTRVWQNATDALDRLFVDLWRNSISSFKDFVSSIKNIFWNMLAEMAHMAITRPIMVSLMGAVGGALGIPGIASAAGGGLLSGAGSSILSGAGSLIGAGATALGIGGTSLAGGIVGSGGGALNAMGYLSSIGAMPAAQAGAQAGVAAATSAAAASTIASIAAVAAPLAVGGLVVGSILSEVFGNSGPPVPAGHGIGTARSGMDFTAMDGGEIYHEQVLAAWKSMMAEFVRITEESGTDILDRVVQITSYGGSLIAQIADEAGNMAMAAHVSTQKGLGAAAESVDSWAARVAEATRMAEEHGWNYMQMQQYLNSTMERSRLDLESYANRLREQGYHYAHVTSEMQTYQDVLDAARGNIADTSAMTQEMAESTGAAADELHDAARRAGDAARAVSDFGGALGRLSFPSMPAYGGGRASGGPVNRGQMYLVGEEGPELVAMQGAGHVFTAEETAKMLGLRAMAKGGSFPTTIHEAFAFQPSGNLDNSGVVRREIEMLKLMGREIQALTLERQLELHEIEDAGERHLAALIQWREEEIRVMQEQADAEKEMFDIWKQGLGIQAKYAELYGDEQLARDVLYQQRLIELEGIDKQYHATQWLIWAKEDEAAVTERAARAAQAYLSGLQRELAVLEGAYNEAKQVYLGLLNEELSAQNQLASALRNVVANLRSVREGLWTGGYSPLGIADQRMMLSGRMSDLTTRAMMGDQDAMNEIASTSTQYLDVSRQMHTDWLDYGRDIARTSKTLERVEGYAEEQLSEAEKQIRQLQDIIDEVNEVADRVTDMDRARSAWEQAKNAFDNSWMHDEIAMLENILNPIVSIEELLKAYLAAGGKTTTGAGGSIPPPPTFSQAEMDSMADMFGIPRGTTYTQSPGGVYMPVQTQAERDFQAWIKTPGAADYYESVEGYRPKGYSDGGISMGPTSGYLATLHGTEAVVPLPNGRSIPVEMNTSDMLAEIRALRKDLAQANYQIAKNTRDTSKLLQRWDDNDAMAVRMAEEVTA